MPRREQQFAVGDTYHVYNRGVNRQPIFFEPDNWAFFLRNVRRYLLGEGAPAVPVKHPGCSQAAGVLGHESRDAERRGAGRGVDVLAYCLMPNHFHLVVRILKADFSYRMQLLSQSYTNAVNKAQTRVGPLFQGRFRAVEVDQTPHLLHLTRYVHRNPLEARLAPIAEAWEFSSYRDYVGVRRGSLPSAEVVLQEFHSREAYRRFVEGQPQAPDAFESVMIDAEP